MSKIKPNIVRGGTAIDLGNNLYLMRGRKHSSGGIDIGRNPRTGLEVEDKEVVQTSPSGLRVFSAQPILGGISPAQYILGGANPNDVFNAQEFWKKANRVTDDGKRYRTGGKVDEKTFTTKLTKKQEDKFQNWYKNVSYELGLDSNPDNPLHAYDYRGFWLENRNKNIDYKQPDFHFTDTYKKPDHPTFSVESKYADKKYGIDPKTVGHWDGENFISGSFNDLIAARTDRLTKQLEYSKQPYEPSKEIIDYIKSTEGFRDKWYQDGKGIWTVGYGFTGSKVRKMFPNGMTREQADKYLTDSLNVRKQILQKDTPNWDSLNQNQRDALLSYHYNIGEGNYRNSPKMQKGLEEKDWDTVSKNIDAGYNDKKNPGLRKRRDYERNLFNTPVEYKFGGDMIYSDILDKNNIYRLGGPISVIPITEKRDNTSTKYTKDINPVKESKQDKSNLRYDDGVQGYLPIIGDILQGAQAVSDLKDKNYKRAALDASLLLVPNTVEKLAKPVVKAGIKAVKRTKYTFRENKELIKQFNDFAKKYGYPEIKIHPNHTKEINKQVVKTLHRHNTFLRGVYMPTDEKELKILRKTLPNASDEQILEYIATNPHRTANGVQFVSPYTNAIIYGATGANGKTFFVERPFKLGEDRTKWIEEASFPIYATGSHINADRAINEGFIKKGDVIFPWEKDASGHQNEFLIKGQLKSRGVAYDNEKFNKLFELEYGSPEYKKLYEEEQKVLNSLEHNTSKLILNSNDAEKITDYLYKHKNKYGGIHIKPSKRGTFTAAAKKHGMSVQGFASKVLANKSKYSTKMIRKAAFAKAASKWKHKEFGGDMDFNYIIGKNNIYKLGGSKKRAPYGDEIIWRPTSQDLHRPRLTRKDIDYGYVNGVFYDRFGNAKFDTDIEPAVAVAEKPSSVLNIGIDDKRFSPYTSEELDAMRKSIVDKYQNEPVGNSLEVTNPITLNNTVPNPSNGFMKPNNNNTAKGNGINSDLIGAGINLVGNLGSFLINNVALNRMKYYNMLPLRANKLKTNFNINPQLDNIRENVADFEEDTKNNTASSKIALSRRQRMRARGAQAINQLYGQKENIETQLINRDRFNQQQVANQNISMRNQWRAGLSEFRNKKLEAKAENAVSAINNAADAIAGPSGYLARRERRLENDRLLARDLLSLELLSATNPNAGPIVDDIIKNGIDSRYYKLLKKQRSV